MKTAREVHPGHVFQLVPAEVNGDELYGYTPDAPGTSGRDSPGITMPAERRYSRSSSSLSPPPSLSSGDMPDGSAGNGGRDESVASSQDAEVDYFDALAEPIASASSEGSAEARRPVMCGYCRDVLPELRYECRDCPKAFCHRCHPFHDNNHKGQLVFSAVDAETSHSNEDSEPITLSSGSASEDDTTEHEDERDQTRHGRTKVQKGKARATRSMTTDSARGEAIASIENDQDADSENIFGSNFSNNTRRVAGRNERRKARRPAVEASSSRSTVITIRIPHGQIGSPVSARSRSLFLTGLTRSRKDLNAT